MAYVLNEFLGNYILLFCFNSDCDTTIRTPTARITSPGFPNNYPLDTVCVTKLRSDVLSSYHVRFLNFTLERSSECLWDSVTIYPGIPDFFIHGVYRQNAEIAKVTFFLTECRIWDVYDQIYETSFSWTETMEKKTLLVRFFFFKIEACSQSHEGGNIPRLITFKQRSDWLGAL